MLTHSCFGVFIQSPCSGQLWRKKKRMRRRRRRRCGRMKHKKYSYEDPASFEHSPLCLFDLEGTFTPRCCCSTGGFLTLLQSTALIMDSYHTAVLRQQSALYCSAVVGGGEGGIKAWPVKKERAETKHFGFRWVEPSLLQFRQFQDRCCGWQRYRTTCDKPQLRSVTSAGTLASPGAMLWRHHITWWMVECVYMYVTASLWRHLIMWWVGGVCQHVTLWRHSITWCVKWVHVMSRWSSRDSKGLLQLQLCRRLSRAVSCVQTQGTGKNMKETLHYTSTIVCVDNWPW